MEIARESENCIAAGCGNAWAGLVPSVSPGETNPAIIAEPEYFTACSEHIDALWGLFGAFGVAALLTVTQGGCDRESGIQSLRAIAEILSSHEHPKSKEIAGLLSAAAFTGLLMKLNVPGRS